MCWPFPVVRLCVCVARWFSTLSSLPKPKLLSIQYTAQAQAQANDQGGTLLLLYFFLRANLTCTLTAVTEAGCTCVISTYIERDSYLIYRNLLSFLLSPVLTLLYFTLLWPSSHGEHMSPHHGTLQYIIHVEFGYYNIVPAPVSYRHTLILNTYSIYTV